MDETTIDREAMGRLAKALAFICGTDHPTTVALKAAAESGAERDIKNAPGVIPQTEAKRSAGSVGDAGRLRTLLHAQCGNLLRGDTAPVLARLSSAVASAISR